MKINSVNINFTKKLVAKCEIKDKQRAKHPASIYEYNPRSIDDMKEIQNGLNAEFIKYNFFKQGYYRRNMPESKFYAMKDDVTGDIIASAQTSNHLALQGKYEGLYTSIDELQASDNYINPANPMVAFIADKAQQTYSKNILTSFRADEAPDLGECKFKKTKSGIWIIRSRGFKECISRAEKRNNLEIIA